MNGEWAAVEAPSGGSGQYVWSKHETENGKILEYVIGDTEADYPDGGWSDGFWYVLKLAPAPTYLSFIGNEDFTLKTYNTTIRWSILLISLLGTRGMEQKYPQLVVSYI